MVNYNNTMFEFILAGDCEVSETIMGEIKRKESCIIFNKLYNIVAYQTWDAHTIIENNHVRRVFSINPFIFKTIIDNFNNRQEEINYKPSCVFRTAEKDYFIVIKEIEILSNSKSKNLSHVNNNFMSGKIKLIVENDFSDITSNFHGIRVPKIPVGIYNDVDLNLSSVSYNDLEYINLNREFTVHDASPAPLFSNEHQFDSSTKPSRPVHNNFFLNAIARPSYNSLPMDKTYNFIIREKCDVVRLNKYVYDVKIKSNKSFITAYEDWNKHAVSNFTNKRVIKHICPSEFTQLVKKYNNQNKITSFKELFKFKPTTFLEINNKPYIGVITDIFMNHLDHHDDHQLTLRFNTWQMRSITDRNLQYPDPTTDAKLYMNIDSTPTTNISSVLTNDLLIKVGLTAIVILESAQVLNTNIFFGFYNLLKFYAIPHSNIDSIIKKFYNLTQTRDVTVDFDSSKAANKPKQVNNEQLKGMGVLSNLQKKLGIDHSDQHKIKKIKKNTSTPKQKKINRVSKTSKYTKNINDLTIYLTGLTPSESAAILSYTLLHFVFYLSYTKGTEFSVNGGNNTLESNENAFYAAQRDYNLDTVKKEKEDFVLEMKRLITTRKPKNNHIFNKSEISRMAEGVETCCNLAFTFIEMLINKDIQIISLDNILVDIPVSKFTSQGKGSLNIRNKPFTNLNPSKALRRLGNAISSAGGRRGERTFTYDDNDGVEMPRPRISNFRADGTVETTPANGRVTLNDPSDPTYEPLNQGGTSETSTGRPRLYSILEGAGDAPGPYINEGKQFPEILVPDGSALFAVPYEEVTDSGVIKIGSKPEPIYEPTVEAGPRVFPDYQPVTDLVRDIRGLGLTQGEINSAAEGSGPRTLPKGVIDVSVDLPDGRTVRIVASPPDIISTAANNWTKTFTGAVSSVSEGGKEFWSRDTYLSDAVIDELISPDNVKDALRDSNIKQRDGNPISEDTLSELSDIIAQELQSESFQRRLRDGLSNGEKVSEGKLMSEMDRLIESILDADMLGLKPDFVEEFSNNLIEKPLVKSFVQQSMQAADSLRIVLNDLVSNPDILKNNDLINKVKELINSSFSNGAENIDLSSIQENVIDILNSTIINELAKALNVNSLMEQLDDVDVDEYLRNQYLSGEDKSELKRLLDFNISNMDIADRLYENILRFQGLDPASTAEFSELKELCNQIANFSKTTLNDAITEGNPKLLNDLSSSIIDAYSSYLSKVIPTDPSKQFDDPEPIDQTQLENKLEFEIKQIMDNYIENYYNNETIDGKRHQFELLQKINDGFADLLFKGEGVLGLDASGNPIENTGSKDFFELFKTTHDLIKIESEIQGRFKTQSDAYRTQVETMDYLQKLYYQSIPTTAEISKIVAELIVENPKLGSFQDSYSDLKDAVKERLQELFSENIKKINETLVNEKLDAINDYQAQVEKISVELDMELTEIVEKLNDLVDEISDDVRDGEIDPFEDFDMPV